MCGGGGGDASGGVHDLGDPVFDINLVPLVPTQCSVLKQGNKVLYCLIPKKLWLCPTGLKIFD